MPPSPPPAEARPEETADGRLRFADLHAHYPMWVSGPLRLRLRHVIFKGVKRALHPIEVLKAAALSELGERQISAIARNYYLSAAQYLLKDLRPQ